MERKPIRSDPATVKRLLEWLDRQPVPEPLPVSYIRKRRPRAPVYNATHPHQGGLPGLGKRS